jgi:prevent-host-death family protein
MAIKYVHSVEQAVKTIAATRFKARCLAILEEVRQTRQPLTVTRHGRPVAEIIPCVIGNESKENPLRGSVLHQGDLLSPIGVSWDTARRRT